MLFYGFFTIADKCKVKIFKLMLLNSSILVLVIKMKFNLLSSEDLFEDSKSVPYNVSVFASPAYVGMFSSRVHSHMLDKLPHVPRLINKYMSWYDEKTACGIMAVCSIVYTYLTYTNKLNDLTMLFSPPLEAPFYIAKQILNVP